MNDKRYQWILYAIVAVIAGTIAIQVYWNLKNYESNKQQLINDVQVSLDNAVEKYYTNLAKEQTYGFAFRSFNNKNVMLKDRSIDSVMHYLDIAKSKINGTDTINLELTDGIKVYEGVQADSMFNSINKNTFSKRRKISYDNLASRDSVFTKDFEMLTSKVIISMTSDSLQLKEIDSIFKEEILVKNLDINYKLDLHFIQSVTDTIQTKLINSSDLYTFSKSPFLPPHNSLFVGFSNSTKEILKRILTGILISILLVLVVISCLFYLLKIIKHQKQLAEVKNDFISNITHEFKTPIATIGVALESIKNFNVTNDTKKTASYIDMSNTQLSKLNVMVEKLLETASLDSENLDLKKEQCNVTNLIENVVQRHTLDITNKSIEFNHPEVDIHATIDVFHFENVINNILDNAIKYGGNEIIVNLNQNVIGFTISISDNGKGFNKTDKDKIFEKFYRVPKVINTTLKDLV